MLNQHNCNGKSSNLKTLRIHNDHIPSCKLARAHLARQRLLTTRRARHITMSTFTSFIAPVPDITVTVPEQLLIKRSAQHLQHISRPRRAIDTVHPIITPCYIINSLHWLSSLRKTHKLYPHYGRDNTTYTE